METKVEEKQSIVVDTKNPKIEPKKFGGVLYTLVYRPHEGFADYSVATVTIKEGQVRNVEISDPWCAVEAIEKMITLNNRLLERLRRAYPAGYQHV